LAEIGRNATVPLNILLKKVDETKQKTCRDELFPSGDYPDDRESNSFEKWQSYIRTFLPPL